MEAILAVVSLGIAVPGTVLAFANCGEYITRRIESFKNAPAVARELGKFGRNLHQGKLKINLDLAEWAYSLPDTDETLKDGLDDHLNELRRRLMEVDYRLGKLFDKRGEVRSYYFAIIGERKAEKLVRSLRDWENDFASTLSLIEMRERIVSKNLLLTRNNYRCRQRSRLDATRSIFVGKAEVLVTGSLRELDVLIEEKEVLSTETEVDLKEVASILANMVSRETFGSGILKCLGYRLSEKAELIFELPEGFAKPRTLQSVIRKDSGKHYGGGRPLDDRLRLARQLCDTIITVFTTGLVHKSIRTDTILLISESESDAVSELGRPFLSSWDLLRKATGLTSGPGEVDQCSEFYRHVKRQGIQPEDRYNIGHDIYSLGVCLLEIGLWTSFFDSDGKITDMYQETAVDLAGGKFETVPGLVRPWEVSKVLTRMAERYLPPRMGNSFTALTIACLTCLDGGMGDIACFQKDPKMAAMRFQELVMQSFNVL